jgi:diguanylate cyclase (GGDEF)-like protein
VLLVVASFGCVWMVTMYLAIALENQARTDPLTGAMNRLALAENMARELARARRNDRPLSLLMFDLDHFKQLNDRLGHQPGDGALQAVTTATLRELRASDLLARYGGEEFVVVLPDTDKAQAAETAERLRRRIEAQQIACGDGSILTASFGVSTFPADGIDLDGLVARTDAMLYAAKQAGRNRVAG